MNISGSSSTLKGANDVWLTLKTKSQLLVDEGVPGHRIKVVTENGTVYLMGLVTQSEADAAVNIVSGLGGVEKIVKIFEYID